MTFEKFHNALRILLNIDGDEFIAAIEAVRVEGDNDPQDEWDRFNGNPYRWFIRSPSRIARAIWQIIEERNQ